MFVIRCDKRDELEKYLTDAGIGIVKYFTISIYLQEAYADLNVKECDFLIDELISKTVLSNPMYYGMTDEQINFVIKHLNSFQIA